MNLILNISNCIISNVCIVCSAMFGFKCAIITWEHSWQSDNGMKPERRRSLMSMPRLLTKWRSTSKWSMKWKPSLMNRATIWAHSASWIPNRCFRICVNSHARPTAPSNGKRRLTATGGNIKMTWIALVSIQRWVSSYSTSYRRPFFQNISNEWICFSILYCLWI